MILGKVYAKIKKSINAAEINVGLKKKDGSNMPRLHRKLRILMLIRIYQRAGSGDYKASQRALNKEYEKYAARIDKMCGEK
ncbi:MAG: hypothetical protein IKJ09_03190 [Bacteroidaceae bacterium]|nr:hypothetical protein [Bacteroidaceae bacterium]